ncbi:hypothetical protein ACHAWF_017823 [Thalassiosira exigua]
MNRGRSRGGGGGDGPSSVRPVVRRSPYAVLNLPPTTTRAGSGSGSGSGSGGGEEGREDRRPVGDDEVRDAYKRLSRLLHPDKRPPGREREDARETFLELRNAYEILSDPALRQAYDNFGHHGVTRVRHDKYAQDSLYRKLTQLHDEGRSEEALAVLQIVFEDAERKRRREEWEYDAGVEIRMSAVGQGGALDRVEWPEVSSTDVSVSASVPLPPVAAPSPFPAQSSSEDGAQGTQRARKVQLGIGGQSSLKNGQGYSRGVLSATYRPLAHTDVSSELTVGHEYLQTSLASTTELANGTGLSARMAREYELGSGKEGKLSFGFSSHRSLTLFHGRTALAMFALGFGPDLTVNYGVLSLTTWGFRSGGTNERPKPRIVAKMTIGSPYPISCSVDQPNLFDSPHRSGRVSVAWSPMQGYTIEGSISRKLAQRCDAYESQYPSQLTMGLEHGGVGGLKWVVQYQRPEGLTIRVPIVLSSLLSPYYWNRAVWISAFSFLIDEAIGDWMGHPMSESTGALEDGSCVRDKMISAKLRANNKERRWSSSPSAKRDAENQLSAIATVAQMKRRREEAVGGLVILKATYTSESKLASDKKSPNNVTQQLQFWVENSRLYLPASPKSALLGFYDLPGKKPEISKDNKSSLSDGCYSQQWRQLLNTWLSRLGIGGDEDAEFASDDCITIFNMLTVRFKYKGQVFEIIVRDDDELELPNDNATVLGSSDIVQ